jgi:hypothetical protein
VKERNAYFRSLTVILARSRKTDQKAEYLHLAIRLDAVVLKTNQPSDRQTDRQTGRVNTPFILQSRWRPTCACTSMTSSWSYPRVREN